MPSEILRQNIILIAKLLGLILAEVPDPKPDNLFDHGDRLRLADNDQPDILSSPSGSCACLPDPLFHLLQVFFYKMHMLSPLNDIVFPDPGCVQNDPVMSGKSVDVARINDAEFFILIDDS